MPRTTHQPGDATAAPPRLLIASQEESQRGELAQRLGRLGFVVRQAQSAAETLRAIDLAPPDVVLLDTTLADSGAMETLTQIRERADPTALPVIVLTPLHQSEQLIEAMSHGANDFLAKPVDLGAAVARIRAQLRLKLIAEENHRLTSRLAESARNAEQCNLDLIRLNIERAAEAEGEQAAGRPSRAALREVHQIGNEAAAKVDRDIATSHVLERGAALLGARRALLLARTGDTGRLLATVPERPDALTEIAAPNSPAADMCAGGMARCGLGQPLAAGKDGAAQQSFVGAPICSATGESVAAIIFERPAEAPFHESDLELARALATVCGKVLDRTSLLRGSLIRMVRMTALRDPSETPAHVQRLAGCAVLLYDEWARRTGLADSERLRVRDLLHAGAILHDIGKVAIPDEILKKPGRLTTAEFDAMKRHTTIGADLCGDGHSPFEQVARDIALRHHERWDGAGYPGFTQADGSVRQCRSDSIPLVARVVGLADVYDALSGARRYKEAWPEPEVLALLKAESGGHFDPALVSIALDIAGPLRAMRAAFPDEPAGAPINP